ncbi:signal peptidase I [Micromonospora pallida]|uniref:Signal peptidase I n=1 Tax=Micromonospora pallida TaxID=145854 RepID=A0A1C6SWX3_9ACTN|nr:signal peptidase I [Micromonospora pallida]SCL33822.1 signal peptidase I [Micromonospora pallida]
MIDEQTDKPRSSFWKELPVLLGVAILVAVLVRAFVLQTFYIPSPSMENTLQINDRVLVNKLVYDFRSPERGEVIVFKAPVEWSGNPDGEDYIKRVIGVGGDHVVCCDEQDRLTINGKSLDEPYIFSMNGQRDKPADQEFDVTIPKGRLWVMGDHRAASGDSLEHWERLQDIDQATIPVDDVVGRAFTVFWPVSRATWLSVPSGFKGIPNP